MDKKRAALIIFGVVLIMILSVVKFAVPIITAANSDGTKTFSNGGISFEYPSNWSESPVLLNQVLAGDFTDILLGTNLGELSHDGSCDLMIQKYSLSGADSTQEFLDGFKADMKDSNVTLNENITNVNGLTINEMLVYSTTPDNTSQKTFFAIFAKGQSVYMLQFNSVSVVQDGKSLQNSSVFEDSIPTFQKIISTIKVD